MKIIRTAAPVGALIAALLVAGCGGSAGGSSDSTSARASAAVTAANQDAVASAALNAALGGSSTTFAVPLGTVDRAAAASAGGVTTGRGLKIRLIELAIGSTFAPLQEAGAIKTAMAARPQAVLTRSQACAAGGSITVTLNDVDNSQAASAGDSASVAFNQCRPSATELVNGAVNFTYTTLSVTTARTDVAAALSFTGLSAQSPGETYSIDGAVTLSASRQGSVTTAQLVVAAGGLALAATTPTHSESLTLGGALTLAVTVDDAAVPPSGGAAGLTTVQISGAVSSNRLAGGTIVISTPVPLKAYESDPYPREGQIVVTGAANSKLRLTAVSTAVLRIELDANGDGTFESSVDRPWGDVI
jgi:hypothetical protein